MVLIEEDDLTFGLVGPWEETDLTLATGLWIAEAVLASFFSSSVDVEILTFGFGLFMAEDVFDWVLLWTKGESTDLTLKIGLSIAEDVVETPVSALTGEAKETNNRENKTNNVWNLIVNVLQSKIGQCFGKLHVLREQKNKNENGNSDHQGWKLN